MIILQSYFPDSLEYEVVYNDEILELNPKNTLRLSQLPETGIKQIVILPNAERMKGENVIIFSTGVKDILESSSFYFEGKILEIPAIIDNEGNINREIKESEINRILRVVFSIKPKHTFICLTNSIRNPLHENSLANLLKGAGYSVTKSVK